MRIIVRTIESGKALPKETVDQRLKSAKLQVMQEHGHYLVYQGDLGTLDQNGSRIEELVYIVESMEGYHD